MEIQQSRPVPPEALPCVYVVLLNWNGWQDTVECVRSLRNMDYGNWRGLIVDNGSTNDSVARLKELCPGVPIIETNRNLGFAAGNNIGIRSALESGADYVFVLNNDTAVSPSAVSEFVAFAESHPEAGLMGPKIGRTDPQREWPIRRKLDLLTVLCTFTALRRMVVRLPPVRDIFYCTGQTPSLAQVLSGSALFFRAAAFRKAGPFDESTFLDFEELIMAEKIRKVGLSVCFVPQAAIWHKGSASAAKLRAKRYIENAKSEEYFFSHYVNVSPLGRSIIRLVRFLTYSARALRYRNYREHFAEFLKALRSRQYVKVG
ncbi:MAG TPA: glycosyltransferase family 2 protein [Terriglobales bacterium]|nr:glycosyltransferase family 2 protein [Terriglobales bacterium]